MTPPADDGTLDRRLRVIELKQRPDVAPVAPIPPRTPVPTGIRPVGETLQAVGNTVQRAETGRAVQNRPKVRAMDGWGGLLTNVYVTFEIQGRRASAFGSAEPDPNKRVRSCQVLTDQQGEAELPPWFILEPGAHVVRATLGTAAPVDFTADTGGAYTLTSSEKETYHV